MIDVFLLPAVGGFSAENPLACRKSRPTRAARFPTLNPRVPAPAKPFQPGVIGFHTMSGFEKGKKASHSRSFCGGFLCGPGLCPRQGLRATAWQFYLAVIRNDSFQTATCGFSSSVGGRCCSEDGRQKSTCPSFILPQSCVSNKQRILLF